MDGSSIATSSAASVSTSKPASQSQIPSILLHGVPMIKLSNKKVKQRTVWLSAEGPSIRWDSRKLGVVRIDQIREVRYGLSASPSQPVPGLTESARTRWITIVYTQPPASWKTLNIVALKDDDFNLWLETISNLLGAIRGISMSMDTGNATGGVIGITGDKPAVAGMNLHQRDSCWIEADQDQDEKISYEEVCRACKRMGIVMNDIDSIIASYCETIDAENKGYLTITDFTLLLKMLKRQPEIQEIYESLTQEGPLDGKRFGQFLREVQKSKLPENEVNRIYVDLVRGAEAMDFESTSTSVPTDASMADDLSVTSEQTSSMAGSAAGLSLEQFTTFLSAPVNAVLDPSQRKVCQDMNRPLSDYFISSSHNTYLIGHQWKGESTVEGYVRALLAGCRSVEMDIYDGDDEPIVYHGKTLTGSVSVRAVCVAIASYAFMASPYPIIISAEMHCGPEQQLKLVGILKDVFGEQLVTAELQTIRKAEATAELAQLPTPEQLKYRILFKSKRMLEPAAGSGSDPSALPAISDSTDTTESSEPDHPLSRSPRARTFLDKVTSKVAKLTTSPPPSPPVSFGQNNPQMPRRSSSLDSRSNSFQLRRSSSASSAVKMSRKQGIVPELAALMIYTAGVKYRGFSKLVEYKAEEMFSVSEKVGTKILRATPLDFIKHNRAHLSRVYPNGTRLTSTNYLPHHFWAMGAQLVALNWQTCDAGFAFNAAMFARNGRSGYILKPEALRSKHKELLAQKDRHILQLTILSGQSLPLPSDVEIDESRLYIEVTVHAPGIDAAKSVSSVGVKASSNSSGSSTSSDSCSIRTKAIVGNAYNPAWKESLRLSFDTYRGLLDLAFVKIEIKNAVTLGDDVTFAHYYASLGSLEQGYRYLPLFDSQMSQYLFSTLFVKIDLTV